MGLVSLCLQTTSLLLAPFTGSQTRGQLGNSATSPSPPITPLPFAIACESNIMADNISQRFFFASFSVAASGPGEACKGLTEIKEPSGSADPPPPATAGLGQVLPAAATFPLATGVPGDLGGSSDILS